MSKRRVDPCLLLRSPHNIPFSDLSVIFVDGLGDALGVLLLLSLVGGVVDSLVGGDWLDVGVLVRDWASPFERDSVGGGGKECCGEVLHVFVWLNLS